MKTAIASRHIGLSSPSRKGNRIIDKDDKYRKRSYQQWLRFYSLKTYYAYLALLIIVGLLLGRWIGTRRQHETVLERKARAEALWKKIRFGDAPHAEEVDLDATSTAGAGADGGKSQSTKHLERLFQRQRISYKGRPTNSLNKVLQSWLAQVDSDIVNNVAGGVRWIRPYLLPSIEGDDDAVLKRNRITQRDDKNKFLKVKRLKSTTMKWQDEWNEMIEQHGGDKNKVPGPIVDYTDPQKYVYPEMVDDLPPASEYPKLKSLKQLMLNWNHDEDYEGKIQESLIHFDYNDPKQLEVAKKFRDNEIPFKLVNVPELIDANKKWTDEYVAKHFNKRGGSSTSGFSWFGGGSSNGDNEESIKSADGIAQESPNNYFAFYTPKRWDVDRMGIPPTRNNDWDFATWSQHANYADAVRLKPEQPHFYWQSGVDREERLKDKSQWTFISRDLPSFSSPTETFFVFRPEEQKGIQCRFGERGVVAATHYDSGRNSVGMITGAKRYILSPPRECSKLGIFTARKSSIYRHSLLNFAHITHLQQDDGGKKVVDGMSEEERHWLERAGQAQSLETVLKAGEVLYIPSHWFHYIVSLQKSAQCNVRAGIDYEGHPVFGNRATVEQCRDYD